MSDLPLPALTLIVTAILAGLTRGLLHRLVTVVGPAIAIGVVWSEVGGALTSLVALAPIVPEGTGARALPSLIDPEARLSIARLFSTVFAGMAFFGAIYSWGRDRRAEMAAALFYAAGALGVAFAADWITLFIFWELMAIGSTTVVWCGGTEKAARAGLRYAVVHFVGGAILMAGIALHLQSGGAIEFGKLLLMTEDGIQLPPLLILIGMLVNAGAPPLGSWLPDAYPEASSTGTVFLSAFTTKTSVLTILIAFPGEPSLMWIGVAMALYGIVFAILENDMRRILAYSIINQVGFMICGIGIGTELALNGACAHAFAHIIYKALLLMSAGAVLHRTGVSRCTDLGGLYRTMPVTLICGTIGALAISAFPLTSGFVSKSMITAAAHSGHMPVIWFALAAASAGVFLHAGIKFPWFVFFQKDSGLRPLDAPAPMKLAMIALSALCIGLGIYYAPLYEILPFESAANEYVPFTFGHLREQLQLLLFSGLAFFVLLPMLKRTNTIVLDFDWFYRRLGPALYRSVLLPFGERIVALFDRSVRFGQRSLSNDLKSAAFGKWILEGWPLGQAVLLITLMLLAYMLLSFQ